MGGWNLGAGHSDHALIDTVVVTYKRDGLAAIIARPPQDILTG